LYCIIMIYNIHLMDALALIQDGRNIRTKHICKEIELDKTYISNKKSNLNKILYYYIIKT